MNNEKDKKLDDLFKKKLEDTDDQIGYREEDWDSLEGMLDKRKRRRAVIYLWPVASGIAAALLLFLGWWFFKPTEKKSNKLAVSSHVVKSHNSTNNINPASTAKTTTGSKQNNALPAKMHTLLIDSSGNKPANLAINAPAKRSHTINQNPVLMGDKKANPTSAFKSDAVFAANKLKPQNGDNLTEATKPATKQLANPVPPTMNNDKNATAAVLPKTANAPIASVNHTDENSALKTGKSAEQPLSSAEKSQAAMSRLLASSAAQDNKVSAKTIASFRPRYALNAIGAEDASGAGSFQQAKAGNKAGVFFSAAISRKLSITTGTLYSSTPYAAAYGDYNFPYQFKNDPVSVSANCKMLDIPLNVGYQVYSRGRNAVTVGTGLSSYIMLQQSFNFSYASYSTAGPTAYTTPNSSSYLFKILNLNATYQRQISSRGGITIQPYLKLPLANVGYSQVKLQTAGVAVGVNWNLGSSKP